VPVSVQQLLRRIDSPSSPSSSSSNSPTSQLHQPLKKPTLIIKSTVVPKPVLQTAVGVLVNNLEPPPLPPKPNTRLDKLEKRLPPPVPENDFRRNSNSSVESRISENFNQIHTHESPIPERKLLTKEMEHQRLDNKVPI